MHQLRIVDGEKLRGVLRELYEEHGPEREPAEWLGLQQPTFHKLLTGKTKKAISFTTYSKICVALGGQPHAHGREMELVPPFAPRPDEPESYDQRRKLALYRAVEPLADAVDTWDVERSWAELDAADLLRPYLRAALKREAVLLRGRGREFERVRKARPPMTYYEYLGELTVRDHFFEDNPGATEADWQAALKASEQEEEIETVGIGTRPEAHAHNPSGKCRGEWTVRSLAP